MPKVMRPSPGSWAGASPLTRKVAVFGMNAARSGRSALDIAGDRMMPAQGANFSVTCWPGRRAWSSAREIGPGEWGLVVRLDPGDMAFTQAPFPTGATEFARWCRELSRAAGQVADAIESTTTSPSASRHRHQRGDRES